MLNISKGNMYGFINHTWNPIKGVCYHNCIYCYMKWISPKMGSPRLVEYELKTDLGKGNFIFVGSSTDMFAENIPSQWIKTVLDYCYYYNDPEKPNMFLLQSKNPQRFLEFKDHPIMKHVKFCTTIESNRFYPRIMNNAPRIEDRAKAMEELAKHGFSTMVTAEPLIQFDLEEMVHIIERCRPEQVNIGRESKRIVSLPEPTPKEVKNLKTRLQVFTEVKIKKNASIWFE